MKKLLLGLALLTSMSSFAEKSNLLISVEERLSELTGSYKGFQGGEGCEAFEIKKRKWSEDSSREHIVLTFAGETINLFDGSTEKIFEDNYTNISLENNSIIVNKKEVFDMPGGALGTDITKVNIDIEDGELSSFSVSDTSYSWGPLFLLEKKNNLRAISCKR